MVRRRTKGDAQRAHARTRFKQRFGINVGRHTQKQLVQMIQAQKNAIFVKRQSNRVTVWDVTLLDHVFRVVYDKRTHNIVTVLPEKNKKDVDDKSKLE